MDRVEVLTCSIEEYMSRSDTTVDKVCNYRLVALYGLMSHMSHTWVKVVLKTVGSTLTPCDLAYLLYMQIALSDIFEYMHEEASEAIFTLLAKSVAPGGRVAFWNLFNYRMPSKSLLQGKMTYLEELSDQLHQVDRAFFYSAFRVLRVN